MKHITTSFGKMLQSRGSVIVDPRGNVVYVLLVDEEGALYCDLDPFYAVEERQPLDIRRSKNYILQHH